MATLGYLRDLVTNERLEWQFNPEDLPVSVGANYADKTPRGASHPRGHYTGSKGRTGSLTLTFIRQTTDGADITALRKRLEALPFPSYDAGGRLRRGPNPILLVFGGMRSLRVRIDDVKLTGGPWFDPETTQPGELRAEITWTDQPEALDLDREDILGGP